jgi:hypothetical protein
LIHQRRGSIESEHFSRWNYYGHSLDVIPGYMTTHAYGGDVLYELQFFLRWIS